VHQMEVLAALLEKIRKDYKDDMSFVVICGSRIYNQLHEKSDVDLYYLAKTPRGNKLSKVFIFEGIGYDIWSIPWDRLLRIASHDERITSIITEGRVIYYASDDDLRKFNELRAIALDISDPLKFITKAQSVLDRAYKDCFFLQSSTDIYDIRMYSIRIIYSVANAVALLNHYTIKRGRGKLKGEVLAMPLVPKDFDSLYDAVFTNTTRAHVKQSYSTLIRNTQELVDEESRKCARPRTFHEGMNEIYKEMIICYNKIRRACEVGDLAAALCVSAELQNELEADFARTGVDARALPNIIQAFDPMDTQKFVKAVDLHQQAVIELVRENGIEIREFRTLDEVKHYLSRIGRSKQAT
jgi:hypothetical protein